MRIKPTYAVYDLSRNKTKWKQAKKKTKKQKQNKKHRNFSATFRHLYRQPFGNLSANLWLSLPSNGS